jgi:hypothetical protein
MTRALALALGLTLLFSAGCVRARNYRYVQKQPESAPG